MKINKETTTPKQQEQQQEQLQEHQQQSPATNGIKQPPSSDTSRASAALSSASPSFPTRRLRVSLSVHCGSTPDSVTTILPYSSCQYIILTCSKRTTPPLALGETSPGPAMPIQEKENSDRGTQRCLPWPQKKHLFTPHEMNYFVKGYLYERECDRISVDLQATGKETPQPERQGPKPPATSPPLRLLRKSQGKDVAIGAIGVAAALNYARKGSP